MASRSSIVSRGFTLIEILVVITIMVLALSITIPAIWTGLSKTRLNAYVRELSATLRFARSQAVTTKSRVSVTLNLDQNSYTLREPVSEKQRLADDQGVRSEEGDGPEVEPEPIGIDFWQERSETLPYDIVGFRQEADKPVVQSGTISINFYPLGNSDGGEVIIQGNRPNFYYLIIIEQITGRVTIHETRTLY
ncbi:GspH/FimT family pseudopilin [bacterium]|nr:GspH/FimT family pseudopilin [bacterium]